MRNLVFFLAVSVVVLAAGAAMAQQPSLAPMQDVAAQGALGLIADKQDSAFLTFDVGQ